MIFNKYNLIVYLINNNGMQIAKHTTFFEPKFHEIRFIVSFDFFLVEVANRSIVTVKRIIPNLFKSVKHPQKFIPFPCWK